MASFGTVHTLVEVACPRCGEPVVCDVQIGPGCAVGTNADGTAELTVQMIPKPRKHVCYGIQHEMKAGTPHSSGEED